jgi:hypothetical protein
VGYPVGAEIRQNGLREPMVLQEHLDALCPELAAVVNDAVASGNELAESWRGFGQAVRLSAPSPMLVGIDQSVREHLAYKPVDDPHYWLGEIHCLLHPEWFIALPYGSDSSPSSPAMDLPRLDPPTA